MKRKPVTLSEDLSRLVDGGIQAGEFSDRSSAIRISVRDYFAENLVVTAALVAAHDELELEAIADVLEVDQGNLASLVGAIDESAAPAEPSSYLADIEAEFPSMNRDGDSGGLDDRTSREDSEDR